MLFSASAILLAASALLPVRAANFTIVVGGADGKLQYTPPTVNASIGDTVIFQFQQKNHTMTQSSFLTPCSPLSGGLDSKFMPVNASVTANFPTTNITIQSMDTIWFYCRQTNHCASGMVGAINPPSQDQFNQFKASAMASGASSTVPALVSSTPAVVTVTETVTASAGDVWTTTYGSYPGSAAPTNKLPTTHVVTVGQNSQLAFSPNVLVAEPGDMVSFVFFPKNHTVTQSTFNTPCAKMNAGFDSGFMPVTNTSGVQGFKLTINDTAPIILYCMQTGHCQKDMFMIINNASFTLDDVKARAESNATTSSGPSGTKKAGALANRMSGMGVVVSLVAAIFCLAL